MNIINDRVKPNLTHKERRRYEMAAEHFMRGSSSFYINHYSQVKKIVDIEHIKENLSKKYNEVIENFKAEIKNKVDYVKENARTWISNFIDRILDGSLIILSGVAIFGNQIEYIKKAYIRYINPLISVGKDGIERMQNFLKESVFKNIDLKKEYKSAVKMAMDWVWSIYDTIMQGVDFFFNNTEYGNVFQDMIRLTVEALFNRSFDSSFGWILELFFDKTNLEASKKPDLYNFIKYGADTYSEVSQIERDFNRIAKQTEDGDDLANFSSKGWVYTYAKGGGGSAKNFYAADSQSEFAALTNEVHLKFMEAASAMVKESPLTNPFADNNPFKSKEYENAIKSVDELLKKEIDIDEHFSDGAIANFYYKGDKFREVISKLDDYKQFFKHSTDPHVKDAIKLWDEIQEKIKRNKDFLPIQSSGINIKMANQMLLLMVVFVTCKRRIQLTELANLDIESYKFNANSEVNNLMRRMKEMENDKSFNVSFDTIDSVKETNQLFISQILNYERSKVFYKAKDNNLFEGKFSPYLIADTIRAIRNELIGMKYHRMGVARRNVYFFNNYSESSDTVMQKMTMEAKDDGTFDYKRQVIDGDKKIIQNKSSLLEITNRLIDAYIKIKIKELDLRKKRQILLIQFQNAVNSITKRKTEYLAK